MAKKVRLKELTQRIDGLEKVIMALGGIIKSLNMDRVKLREEFGDCLDMFQRHIGDHDGREEESDGDGTIETPEGDSGDGLDETIYRTEAGESEVAGRVGRSTSFDKDGHPIAPTGSEEGSGLGRPGTTTD